VCRYEGTETHEPLQLPTASKVPVRYNIGMKTLVEIESILREHRAELREKYGIAEMGVFGSYVKGEQREDSDVDILVSLERPVGLLTFIGAGHYIEHLLGVPKVDLVMRETLKPFIGRLILQEVRYV
jgi:uncharacterized protein